MPFRICRLGAVFRVCRRLGRVHDARRGVPAGRRPARDRRRHPRGRGIIIFNLYAIQRRRQEALDGAQAKVGARDRAKSAFLSSVSHDIRTPMNAIVGYIELARRAGDDLGRVREYVGKLEASSHHLMALINDVLEMRRDITYGGVGVSVSF